MRVFLALICLLCLVSPITVNAQESNLGVKQQVIQFQRTTCYGECPSYIITVFDNGDFIWQGGKYVKRSGVFRGHGNPQVFEQTISVLEEAKIRDFNNDYVYGESEGCKENWTDNPSIRIYVQTNKYTKEVWHNTGCRGFDREKELLSLEKALDQSLETERWIEKRR